MPFQQVASVLNKIAPISLPFSLMRLHSQFRHMTPEQLRNNAGNIIKRYQQKEFGRNVEMEQLLNKIKDPKVIRDFIKERRLMETNKYKAMMRQADDILKKSLKDPRRGIPNLGLD